MESVVNTQSVTTRVALIRASVLEATRLLSTWVPNHYNSGGIETMVENASKCYRNGYLPGKMPVHAPGGVSIAYPSFKFLADNTSYGRLPSFEQCLERAESIDKQLKRGQSFDLSQEEITFLLGFAKYFTGVLNSYLDRIKTT